MSCLASRSVYPVIFIDAINVKIREGQVANRPIDVALAVNVDGERDILGLWAGEHGDGEGAKFWLRVLAEVKNRGTADVCMVICDGLEGLPDAIEQVWPQAVVQTCVVHLLRNSFNYASRSACLSVWLSNEERPVGVSPRGGSVGTHITRPEHPAAASRRRTYRRASSWSAAHRCPLVTTDQALSMVHSSTSGPTRIVTTSSLQPGRCFGRD